MSTHVLKPGESVEAKGKVTVRKCGLHRQGGGDPEPTVTLEVEDGITPQSKPKTTRTSKKTDHE